MMLLIFNLFLLDMCYEILQPTDIAYLAKKMVYEIPQSFQHA